MKRSIIWVASWKWEGETKERRVAGKKFKLWMKKLELTNMLMLSYLLHSDLSSFPPLFWQEVQLGICQT